MYFRKSSKRFQCDGRRYRGGSGESSPRQGTRAESRGRNPTGGAPRTRGTTGGTERGPRPPALPPPERGGRGPRAPRTPPGTAASPPGPSRPLGRTWAGSGAGADTDRPQRHGRRAAGGRQRRLGNRGWPRRRGDGQGAEGRGWGAGLPRRSSGRSPTAGRWQVRAAGGTGRAPSAAPLPALRRRRCSRCTRWRFPARRHRPLAALPRPPRSAHPAGRRAHPRPALTSPPTNSRGRRGSRPRLLPPRPIAIRHGSVSPPPGPPRPGPARLRRSCCAAGAGCGARRAARSRGSRRAVPGTRPVMGDVGTPPRGEGRGPAPSSTARHSCGGCVPR